MSDLPNPIDNTLGRPESHLWKPGEAGGAPAIPSAAAITGSKSGPASISDLVTEFGNRMLMLGETKASAPDHTVMEQNVEETRHELEHAIARLQSGSRGTPSTAQLNAARLAWPQTLPPPSDRELEEIVHVINRAPWPDLNSVARLAVPGEGTTK